MTTIQSHRVSPALQGIDRAPVAAASGFDEALRPHGGAIACSTEECAVLPRPQDGCAGIPTGTIDDCASLPGKGSTGETCATLGGPPGENECATIAEWLEPATCEPQGRWPAINSLNIDSVTIPMSVLRLEINLASFDLAGRLVDANRLPGERGEV